MLPTVALRPALQTLARPANLGACSGRDRGMLRLRAVRPTACALAAATATASVKSAAAPAGPSGRSRGGDGPAGRGADGPAGPSGRDPSCAHRWRPGRAGLAMAATQATAGSGAGLPPPLLSVAPMMDVTDVHFRQFARLLSRHTWLWTEMVVDQTLLFKQREGAPLDRLLALPLGQHPAVLQLGGWDPASLAAAAALAAPHGYDEVNLNCGCPSPKVAGNGGFGAALMLDPGRVAEACAGMRAALAAAGAASAEVSVKCRTGVDDVDSYDSLARFIDRVSSEGRVTHFVIHARKAVLGGLSPAQNRTIPPLMYERVRALARDFPQLRFTLNGGIAGCHAAAEQLALGSWPPTGDGCGTSAVPPLVGVMFGRAASDAPWRALADADRAVYGAASNPAGSRRLLLEAYAAYADEAVGRWGTKPDGYREPSVRAVIQPILNLFHGERQGKAWRRAVDEALHARVASVRLLLEATLPLLPDEVLDAPPEDSAAPPAGVPVRPRAAATLAEMPPRYARGPEAPVARELGGLAAAH